MRNRRLWSFVGKICMQAFFSVQTLFRPPSALHCYAYCCRGVVSQRPLPGHVSVSDAVRHCTLHRLGDIAGGDIAQLGGFRTLSNKLSQRFAKDTHTCHRTQFSQVTSPSTSLVASLENRVHACFVSV